MFYEGKPISKFEKTKADKREKGIPWQSNDVTLNLTGEEGVNYVLGPNGSKLRMYIEKDDEKLIKVQLVNPSNWPYEKVLKFIDELNTGKLIYKYTRKRRGEISKLNRRKRKNLNGEKKSEEKKMPELDINTVNFDKDDSPVIVQPVTQNTPEVAEEKKESKLSPIQEFDEQNL